jgi:hypothetical protein
MAITQGVAKFPMRGFLVPMRGFLVPMRGFSVPMRGASGYHPLSTCEGTTNYFSDGTNVVVRGQTWS